MAGFRVNHEGVSHHFRMNIPAGHHQVTYEFQAVVQFSPRPSGQPLINSSHAGRIGHDTVFALDTSLTAPITKLADKVIGDLSRSCANPGDTGPEKPQQTAGRQNLQGSPGTLNHQ